MLGKILFSYWFTIIMLFILGAGAGIATFIENDFGSQSAKILVYHSTWYAMVMLFLSISLLGIIYKRKMYKKVGVFLFHIGFIVVLLGAGITRYFGYEGVLHVREGVSENRVISEESYLQIFADDTSFKHPLSLSKLGNNNFSFSQMIRGKKFEVTFDKYQFSKNSNIEKLFVKATYNGRTDTIAIDGGHGSVEPPAILRYGNLEVGLSWGSKVITLPFSIKLLDFHIERYPGSQSPSSYASDVTLIDAKNDTSKNQKIFMNHPMTYGGFKFFQSSYDKDELGTILSVNHDPGKWPTYIGYLLLTIGFIGNFFTKKSRFAKLTNFVQKGALSLTLLCSFMTTSSYADNTKYLEHFKKNSLAHATKYGALLVQDYNGRIKPLSTESIDLLHKLSGKDSMLELTPEQIMLGIFSNPIIWENFKIIKIKNKKIKNFLHLPLSQNFISFSDVFSDKGFYLLKQEVAHANEKNPSQRGTYEKDLIQLDERLNIFYLASKGFFSKYIPHPADTKKSWQSPQDAVTAPWLDAKIRQTLYMYHSAVNSGIKDNNWQAADKALLAIKNYQEKNAKDIIPNTLHVKVELLFNKLKIFKNLINFYLIFGMFTLIIALCSIFFQKKYSKFNKLIVGLFSFAFFCHSVGLLMRWFISNHAPWSDTYESLVYIAWSAALAGIITKKSLFVLAASSLLAGIFMLVAHLSFISPQITPLVPVLKSYWLSIHVSVITASYGFLGLGAILGFITLFLMIIPQKDKKELLEKQIRQLVAINEISLIVGLALLTIGTFLGGIWANESWGRYWGWDPKETWSFVSIVVYTIVLHVNFIPKLNTAYIFSIASIMAFASIVMTYFGVNFYLSGLHSYASGDKAPIPSFVYYVGIALLLSALLAYKNRSIKGIK